jgi:hypothetical protein
MAISCLNNFLRSVLVLRVILCKMSANLCVNFEFLTERLSKCQRAGTKNYNIYHSDNLCRQLYRWNSISVNCAD